ncbi:MAG: RNA polymerase sigma factor [Limisphaerales bacterium]
MAAPDEADLLARCRAGDGDAWGDLFDRHYAATVRFIFQLAPQFTAEDADEVGQEAFLAVIRHLDEFDGRSAVQTWIFRIAANKARDFMEKQRAAKRGGGVAPLSLHAPDPGTGLAPDPPSPAAGPAERLLAAERHAEVHAALAALGDPCRELLELRYFGGLDYGAIGSTLGLNLKTVSSRLSRCLDRLGERLRAGEAEPTPLKPVQ